MSIPTITCKASLYRIICPFTLKKEDRDSKMDEFINSKIYNIISPIKGFVVVDMQPIDYERHCQVYYGINYILINFIKFMRDFKKTVYYPFFIKLVDDNDKYADYCSITKQSIPFHYYFNSETITLKPVRL